MNQVFKNILLFLFFIIPKINYAQDSILLDSATYYSIQTSLKGICNKLPISYQTEDLMIEKIMHSFFLKYPINKETVTNRNQFIADFGTCVQNAEKELNDTTKYFWTLERQLQMFCRVKKVISIEKIEVDNQLKFAKSYITALQLKFPLGFKDLTEGSKGLLITYLFYDVLNDYKGNTIELEDLIEN